VSKKAAKKEEAKLEKLRRCQEASSASAAATAAPDEEDPLAGNYREVPMPELQSKEEVREPYTAVRALAEEMKDETVVVRGRAQTIRAVGKKMAFLAVMEKGFTVQCIVTEKEGLVTGQPADGEVRRLLESRVHRRRPRLSDRPSVAHQGRDPAGEDPAQEDLLRQQSLAHPPHQSRGRCSQRSRHREGSSGTPLSDNRFISPLA